MQQSWTVNDLTRSILREWVTLISVTVTTLILAVAAFLLWPVRFESTAVVALTSADVGQQSSSSSINMETQRIIGSSTDVLKRAAAKLQGVTVSQLRANVDVSVPKGAQVLEFTYTAPDSDQSAERANAIAEAFLSDRAERAQTLIDASAKKIVSRIDELSSAIAALPPNDPTRASFEAQLQALRQSQASQVAVAFDPGALVSPGVGPNHSTTPPLAVFLLVGLALGVLVGGFIALFVSNRHALRRVRGPGPHDKHHVDARQGEGGEQDASAADPDELREDAATVLDRGGR